MQFVDDWRYVMKNYSRRNFLSAAALGTLGLAISPSMAFADSRSQAQSSGLSETQIDAVAPAMHIDVFDSETGDVSSTARCVISSKRSDYDQETMEGVSECTFDVIDEFAKDAQGAISTCETSSKKYEDVIASISIKATWNLSSNGKKINLTKIAVTFNQKKGDLSNRYVAYRNGDGGKKYKNAALKFSETIKDGYQLLVTDRENYHYVTAWATATASGMGSSKKISCFMTFGD